VGEPVAAIRWHTWSERFEILDVVGAVIAEGRPHGFFRRHYTVYASDGSVVVDLLPGGWRPYNGATIELTGGRSLTLRQQSMWSDRRFEFHAAQGLVGTIEPTTGSFSFRPDSYAFELVQPALSALEAIALAQALRAAVRGQRAAAAGS
jgi:hypothetical protein